MSPETIAHWLERNAAKSPDAPAFVTDDDTLTWSALVRRAADVAAGLPLGEAVPVDHAENLALLAFAGALAGSALMPAQGPVFPVPGGVRLVVPTSGTEEGPKAVMLSEANIVAAVRASRARIPLGPEDCWLCPLPFVHIGGLSVLYRAAEAGACVRFFGRFDAPEIRAALDGGGITHISLVPAMMARMLDANETPPPGLRHALVGGGPLSADLATRAQAAGWPVAVTYGLTEATSQVATLPTLPEDWTPGLVGRPLDGMEVEIAPDGRIRIKGPAVMAGYANPQGRLGDGLDADGWFTTGDLGKFDDSGRLVVRGRADDVLITGGETVHPSSVEAKILSCPGVRDAAVTARADPTWGDFLVAVAVGNVTESQFLVWCRETLPSAERPRAVRIVSSLPRTPLGKVDRKALRRMAEGSTPGRDSEAR